MNLSGPHVTTGVNTWTGLQTIRVVGNPLSLSNTTDGASVQVALIEGDRATPANNDEAFLSFFLSDSAGNQDEQARFTWLATTVLAGATQDGQIRLSALLNNALTEYMRVGGASQRTAIYGAASGPDPVSALHIWQGSSGGAVHADTVLTVERNQDIAITITAPSANVRTIFFGEPLSETRAFIQARGSTNATPDTIDLGVSGSLRFRLSASTIALQQATTITTIAATNLTLNPLTTGALILQSGGTEFFRANNTGIGFYAVAPVARPSAYTQTFATADKTHAAETSANFPAGGVGAAEGAWDTAVNRDAAISRFNALRDDVRDVKQLVNSIIDDLQALGLLQ